MSKIETGKKVKNNEQEKLKKQRKKERLTIVLLSIFLTLLIVGILFLILRNILLHKENTKIKNDAKYAILGEKSDEKVVQEDKNGNKVEFIINSDGSKQVVYTQKSDNDTMSVQLDKDGKIIGGTYTDNYEIVRTGDENSGYSYSIRSNCSNGVTKLDKEASINGQIIHLPELKYDENGVYKGTRTFNVINTDLADRCIDSLNFDGNTLKFKSGNDDIFKVENGVYFDETNINLQNSTRLYNGYDDNGNILNTIKYNNQNLFDNHNISLNRR